MTPPDRVTPDEGGYPAGPIVRPYALTGGRTRSRYEIAVEAIVLTTALGNEHATRLSGEQRAIVIMCRRARSVAEVAAGLAVPLGVARVLVGDLADDGFVRVHQADHNRPPDPALLERVLRGLRRL